MCARPGLAFTLLFVALLTGWKIHCIGLGPDPDTDAYGHFVIARQFLETPLNLHIHWVWLPLYHLLIAFGIALGAGLEQVRYANALLGSCTPLLLFWLLAHRTAAHEHATLVKSAGWVPALGALLAAAAPLGVELGTTGQTESCFTLLLLGCVACLTLERYVLAGVVLALLVLLRYEAWAVLGGVGAVLTARELLAKGIRSSSRRARAACLLLPALAILGWVILRRASGEPWLDFLHQNQAFAEAALAGRPPAPGFFSELQSALGNPALLAASPVIVCGIAGLPRAVRQHGLWFLVVPLSVAAFLSLGSLTRSHLGLLRHWACLIPFAAGAVAHGTVQVAAGLRRLSPRVPSSLAFAATALAVLLPVLLALDARLASWQAETETALLDRRAAGRFLRSLPAGALIVCDEASVEVVSGLPAERFVRAYLGTDAEHTLRSLARTRDVYVLSWAARLRSVTHLGDVVYGPSDRDGLLGVHIAQQDPARPAFVPGA